MGETAEETAKTAETAETAEPCETVDLAPAAVLVRHGQIFVPLSDTIDSILSNKTLWVLVMSLCDLLSCFGSSFVSLFW